MAVAGGAWSRIRRMGDRNREQPRSHPPRAGRAPALAESIRLRDEELAGPRGQGMEIYVRADLEPKRCARHRGFGRGKAC